MATATATATANYADNVDPSSSKRIAALTTRDDLLMEASSSSYNEDAEDGSEEAEHGTAQQYAQYTLSRHSKLDHGFVHTAAAAAEQGHSMSVQQEDHTGSHRHRLSVSDDAHDTNANAAAA